MNRRLTHRVDLIDRLKLATIKIVDSYGSSEAVIQHLNRSRLPSREKILTVLTSVQELIFPGYFGILGLDESNIGLRAQNLVHDLFHDLDEQVRICILLDNPEMALPEISRLSESVTLSFIDSIPDLRSDLSLDVQAAFDGDPAAHSYDELIISYPGIYAVMIYRIAHALTRLHVPLIPRIMTELAHSATGIDIHPGAEIGNSFFIDHGTGVVIGETTLIGNNVKIYQGVTLGALSFPKTDRGELIRGTKRHPTIEDNVIIYSGATILGGDTIIGEGSIIGGNVWLTHSVPPRTKVTLDEPQIRMKQAPLVTTLT